MVQAIGSCINKMRNDIKTYKTAGGERTVKLHGSGEGIHVNGVFSGGYTNNQNYTLYVSPYMVLNKGGRYTKHIYIDSQRMISKLANVDSFSVDLLTEKAPGWSPYPYCFNSPVTLLITTVRKEARQHR